jgi:phospholipid/cholesterol/gamma-HCH transport system permease protein
VTAEPTHRQRSLPRRAFDAIVRPLRQLGEQVEFYGRAYGLGLAAFARYRKEVLRLLAEVSLGSGALAVIGGTVVVVAGLNVSAGAEVGILGFSSLQNIGLEALTGFGAAYITTREVGPFITIFALVATIGAGFTAQLGAMRVSEEIDALEVMAVPSITYLVSTRIVAGVIAVVPIYVLGLLTSYAATKGIVTVFFSQSSGTYQHYFSSFLYPIDIVLSSVKVVAMTVVLMAIQCFYGFRAGGGPAGVGRAVGVGVRNALIVSLFVDLLLDMFFYGGPSTVRISI